MFTREDYKNYFEQIALTERMMVYQVNDIMAAIEDNSIKATLNAIANDEISHYASMMKLFDDILLKSDAEKRAFTRKHSLGKARIKDMSSGEEIEAYSVNISEKGLCVELSQPVHKDKQYDIWLQSYGNEAVIKRLGVIKWSVQISPAFFMVGIRYRAGLEFES